MRVVAFAGSLRKTSYNRGVLFALGELAPPEMAIEIHGIDGIPLFDQDVESEGTPPSVQRLRDVIAASDGLIIATPEYNAGMPGVLKNAVDWLSRPPGLSVLTGKPTAVLGVTPGHLGTARAQVQLRAALEFSTAPVMPGPQVYIGLARAKFDAEGRLTDDKTRAFLGKYLEAFARWVNRNSP